jgi:hypothetical protein
MGQFDQRRSPWAQGRQSRDGPVSQTSGSISGSGQTHSTGVRRFAQCRVSAGGLSEYRRITFNVENVILDLEGETDLVTK